MEQGTQPSVAQALQALREYIEWNGAEHDEEEDCPGDDTCDCRYRAMNDGVNAAYHYLEEHVALRAECERLRAAERRVADILYERRNDNTKEACDACEQCGPAFMCSYHSVLSELSDRVWTDPAIERANLKARLKKSEASVQALLKALEERSRQFHQAEQARTRGYVGMRGSWGGQVTTDWGACPSHPCCEDRKLLAGGEAATQEGKP